MCSSRRGGLRSEAIDDEGDHAGKKEAVAADAAAAAKGI